MTETQYEPLLISIRDTCTLTSLSRATVNKMRARGQFPKAVTLAEKRIAFVRAEIVAWVEQRIATRDQGQRS